MYIAKIKGKKRAHELKKKKSKVKGIIWDEGLEGGNGMGNDVVII